MDIDDEDTAKLRAIRKHVCLEPEHHEDFLDSFIYTGMTEEAMQSILSNGVEIKGNVIHFPKGGIHPEHGRKMVMFPDENENIVMLRHWKLPDGTIIRHATNEGLIQVDTEEKM